MDQDTRTRTLLASMASGGSPVDLQALLANGHVAVIISTEVARLPQAQLLLSCGVNLLGRLHPVVQRLTVVADPDVALAFTPPRWRAASLAGHVYTMLTAINSPLEWSVTCAAPADGTWTLTIGNRVPEIDNQIFIGADGWLAHFSPSEPAPIGDMNPIGAYAAACIGVSEVWKRLLAPHDVFRSVPIRPQGEALTFSTLTYTANQATPNPPLPPHVHIPRLLMAGLGAGGGAAAYALASLPKLSGWLGMIDPDQIDGPNLNRYVHADQKDALGRRDKVVASRRLFERFSNVAVMVSSQAFRDAVPRFAPGDFEYVLAAAHSREARRDIQMETPKVLWDAGATEDGEFRVWRLRMGETECMHCKHPLSDQDPEVLKARQLAQALGLDADAWLAKIRHHSPFSGEEIARIAHQLEGKDISFDLPAEGQRFDDWEGRQCGKLKLPAVDDSTPVPFAPVMAGVLLAGEVIKEFHLPEYALRSVYWNTLMGRFMVRNAPHLRTPRERCSFCSDPTFIAQYASRWKVLA